MSVVTAVQNTLSLAWVQQLLYGLGQTLSQPISMAFRSLFKASGTAADQCQLVHNKTYTFVASTPQTIDLQSLLDVNGTSISFSAVRMLAIRVNATTDGQVLLVGNAGANEWDGITSSGGKVVVYPSSGVNDGFMLFQMPNTTGAVVTGTTHLLKLDPGSSAFTADVLIVGFCPRRRLRIAPRRCAATPADPNRPDPNRPDQRRDPTHEPQRRHPHRRGQLRLHDPGPRRVGQPDRQRGRDQEHELGIDPVEQDRRGPQHDRRHGPRRRPERLQDQREGEHRRHLDRDDHRVERDAGDDRPLQGVPDQECEPELTSRATASSATTSRSARA